VQDAELRVTLGRNARRRVCEEREWGKLVRVYADTYAKVLNETGGSRDAA